MTVLIRLTAPGSTDGVAGWSTKRAAKAALARLRQLGRNTEPCVQPHPAIGPLRYRWWVIARPDPLHEFTWLMRHDGSWLRGRLYDQPPTGGGALWQPSPPPDGRPIPATITHHYRLAGGLVEVTEAGLPSVGMFGQPLSPSLSYVARVWCVACEWSATATSEHEARDAAQHHRSNPGSFPLRTDTGRLLNGQRPLATAAA